MDFWQFTTERSTQAHIPASSIPSEIRATSSPSTTLHLAADHSYFGQRIALETAVVDWLKQLPH
jgi:hypothetical protein